LLLVSGKGVRKIKWTAEIAMRSKNCDIEKGTSRPIYLYQRRGVASAPLLPLDDGDSPSCNGVVGFTQMTVTLGFVSLGKIPSINYGQARQTQWKILLARQLRPRIN